MCHKQYSSIPSNSKVNPANKIFKHYVELKLQPTYILSALTTQQTKHLRFRVEQISINKLTLCVYFGQSIPKMEKIPNFIFCSRQVILQARHESLNAISPLIYWCGYVCMEGILGKLCLLSMEMLSARVH